MTKKTVACYAAVLTCSLAPSLGGAAIVTSDFDLTGSQTKAPVTITPAEPVAIPDGLLDMDPSIAFEPTSRFRQNSGFLWDDLPVAPYRTP
jgi:hypothetical protein